MFTIIARQLLLIVADILMRAALDALTKRVLSEAIRMAEEKGGTGQEKMHLAISHVREQGIESLKNVTESKLRTLLEQTIDRLGV